MPVILLGDGVFDLHASVISMNTLRLSQAGKLHGAGVLIADGLGRLDCRSPI